MNRPFSEPVARVLRNPPADAEPLRAIPHDFPKPELSHGGVSPAAVYAYHNADGSRAFIIKRMETSKGKQILPLSVWQAPDGQLGWYMKALPDARPVYRLHEMLSHPEKTVLVSEGEKCADAAAAFSKFASVSWSGGSNAIGKTDFSPLADRNVIILPDLDEAGAKAAGDLVSVLGQAGALSIRRLDMQALAKHCEFEVEAGFDIADAIDLGLSEARFSELLDDHSVLEPVEMPAQFEPEPKSTGEKEDKIKREVLELFGIESGKIPGPFSLSSQGVIKHDADRRGNPVDTYSGSPAVVLGRTYSNNNGRGWGYLVGIRTPTGKWETLTVPARLLAGDGRELRELLADAGAIVPQDRAGRQAQAEYIGYAQHGPIVNRATRPGWHGDGFALPQGNIRSDDAENDLMIDMGERAHFLKQSGSLEGWRKLASYAENNSRACFAISAALAAPLLRILDRQGGGFHLHGQSSRGKTTFLMLGGSVWGGGGDEGFVRSWYMTGNGAEAALADHNDLLLPLDEMTVAAPELVSALNYLFTNGHGKGRAKQDGSARAILQTRIIVLSSGEHSTAQQVDIGRGRTRMTGGQAVRMIDIPVEYAPGDSFEDLSGFESSGELAEALAALAKTHYGHAGPAFVQAIINRRAEVAQEAEQIIQMMIDGLVEPGDDPQVRRVAAKFGVVAAAAKIASDAGIVPWHNTAGIKACAACFREWKAWRGGGKSQEETAALADLKAFFETHGRTRFERISGRGDSHPDEVPQREDGFVARDRCGYYEEHDDEERGPVYYVFPEAFRRDVCGEHSPDLVIAIAEKFGALVPDNDGKHKQRRKRLPDFPNGTRVYCLQPDALP